MNSDAEQYGAIVDALVGEMCERSLATNSVKLRFETADEPGGRQYIWIDPPWVFLSNGQEVTTSRDYHDDTFEEWSTLFEPLNQTTFTDWGIDGEGSTVFRFNGGYAIALPAVADERESGGWYLRWYARDAT